MQLILALFFLAIFADMGGSGMSVGCVCVVGTGQIKGQFVMSWR